MKNHALLRYIRRNHIEKSGMKTDRRGYIFYGDGDPALDELIFERYFRDYDKRGIFIECGAHDGFIGSNCKFFEEVLGWSGYNIEPTPETFKKLQENRPSSKNFNFALSDKTGEITFVFDEKDSALYKVGKGREGKEPRFLVKRTRILLK
jgi:hypothetical protein